MRLQNHQGQAEIVERPRLTRLRVNSRSDRRGVLEKEIILPGLRIGVQLSSFRQPFKQALHTAAKLGVTGVEIDARTDLRPSEISGSALRQVRKMLSDLSLRVVAVRLRTRRGYGELDELDRRVAATKEVMKMAHDLGAQVVCNQIGPVGSDASPESLTILRSVIADLDRFGQHVGAFLACETGSESIEELVAFLESLPESTIGLTLNPGNLLVNGFDLKGLPQAAKHVMLVHAKDGVRDLARGRGTEVPLGRGLAEFPDIVATLEERHFAGYYVVEREMTDQPIEDVALSVQFLNNIGF